MRFALRGHDVLNWLDHPSDQAVRRGDRDNRTVDDHTHRPVSPWHLGTLPTDPSKGYATEPRRLPTDRGAGGAERPLRDSRRNEAHRSYADDHDLTTLIHLAETATDDATCLEHVGEEAIDVLAAGDLLSGRLLAVHGVELTDRAISSLATAGAAVSWNPVSNMRLGSGVIRVGRLIDAGIAVGLGVDGAGSNDRKDMLETIRTGAYLQRATHKRADVYDFATMIG